ncbi:MAG: molybdopterin-dependent oxidoreductase [Sandaracinaceae bacterium]
MTVTTHPTFCRICEALCGLEVDVEDGAVRAVRPDARHVATEGFSCVKGLKQHRLYASPDRLLYPQLRDGGRLRRATWDEALARIGEAVPRIRSDHGPDAVAMYVGTAAGFSILHPIFAQGFMTGVGSRSMYSSATQDCSNKFAVARHVYGFPFLQPFPDLDRIGCLIVVGANPVVSKWSFLQVPNPARRLKAIVARGGRLFFVDPRRTESAKVAGEHVFIRPGTDAFFYASFLHELIAEGAVDHGRVAAHMRGWSPLAAFAERWPPERTAPATGIEPRTLRAMVRAYAEADGAALYCSTGVNMGGQGALAFWLQEAINAVSGNLDRRGGTLVGRGIFDFPKLGKRAGTLMSSARSRVGGFGQVNDGFPGGILADEILTPGRGQIRALFVTGGNPLLTMADAGRLRDAFRELELLVALDVLPSETAQQADVVLPCTSPLERPDLPFVFPLWLGMQRRPYLQATRAVVPARGEQRDEATIYTQIARACGTPLFGSRLLQWILERSLGARADNGQPRLPLETILSLMLRLSRQPSFGALLEHPHGKLREDHRGGDFLGARVLTDDGRVDLAPPPLLAAARSLDGQLAERLRDGRRLRLITRRAVTTHNSWTHNLPDFVKGERGTNYLYMHPEDLARIGLSDGDLADVRSDAGAVRVPVRRLADLMPGTVALPHGWGHQRATGLSVASGTRGVNANLLAASGPASVDPVSGMSRLTAIGGEVTRAEGAQDPSDWSGLPG